MSTVIESELVESIEELLIPFQFVFIEDGTEHTVSDKDLNSQESALGYAKKEFLNNGMDIQTIIFQTYARGLNINDVVAIVLPNYKIPIDLTKNRVIVTEITTEYLGAKALDTITGIRYD